MEKLVLRRHFHTIWLCSYNKLIADNVDFEEWYFGHFHEDVDIENFHCRMDEVALLV